MSEQEPRPGIWGWVRIPIDTLSVFLFSALTLGFIAAFFMGKNSSLAFIFSILLILLYLAFIGRLVWNIYTLWKKKKGDFWIVVVFSILVGIFFLGGIALEFLRHYSRIH